MANCYDCGLKYGTNGWIEAIVPDKVWFDISPTGDYGGILCINCISNRIEKMNYCRKVPVLLCGTEPILPIIDDGIDKSFTTELILKEWHPNHKIIKDFEERVKLIEEECEYQKFMQYECRYMWE